MKMYVSLSSIIVDSIHLESDVKNFCNERFVHTMVFEYAEDCLGDLMKQRRMGKKNVTLFTEHEVWTVLSQILQGLNYLYTQGVYFGDMQPNNIIVFDKPSLQVKLFDPKYCVNYK